MPKRRGGTIGSRAKAGIGRFPKNTWFEQVVKRPERYVKRSSVGNLGKLERSAKGYVYFFVAGSCCC